MRPTRSWEQHSRNDLPMNRVEQPVVAPYQRPPLEDAGQQQLADIVKPSNVPRKLEASQPIGANACFQCGRPGHYANDCPGNNGCQGDKPQAYIRTVQTAIPDDDVINSGNKPDVKDDEVDNLIGNVPEDDAASEAGEHPGNEFVEVDIYDNDYYARESDTEFMRALTDYMTSELDRPIGAGNVKDQLDVCNVDNEEFADLLNGTKEELPPWREVNHKINFIDENKVYKYHLLRCLMALQQQLRDKTNQYLQAQWWEAQPASQAAPLLCIPKKDGTLRTALDACQHNENT
ncbi:hypothetical protein C0992_008925, partial [Termitomyces sp. T32_za158]